MLRKVPLIVLIGSTGTGKTKLSIELARRFNGEIISADSMQVYKGLNVATAKATDEEQKQAAHHLLDIVTPNESFTVTHFRDKALPIIHNLFDESKIPIVVGGTNYWIEAVLWKNLLSPGIGYKRKIDTDYEEQLHGFTRETQEFLSDSSWPEIMSNMESEKLYEHLKVIDPLSANKFHPNNKRKIMRALEVYKDYGQRLSELIEDQRKGPGASNLGGPKRFEHVLIFWLQCDQECLNDRLNKRVDSMVKNGLLTEIRTFYDNFILNRPAIDFEEGILQTIGFKEFVPYLKKYEKNHDALINEFVEASETLPEPEGYKSLLSCLEELKLVTRRYSKQQLKWIRNRFLGSEFREIPFIYPLDTSNVSRWHEMVYEPAEKTIFSYINGEELKLTPLSPIEKAGKGLNEETTNFCEDCNRTFIGEFQYQAHLTSNKHKRVLFRKRRELRAREKINKIE